MKFQYFTVRKLFQYYLPVTLILFVLVTIEWHVDTDGGFDRLYGFPLPYISNSYALSFHYDVSVLALVFDLFCYALFTVLIFVLVEKAGLKLKTHWVFVSLGVLVSLFLVTMFVFITQESSFKMTFDMPYVVTGWKWDI